MKDIRNENILMMLWNEGIQQAFQGSIKVCYQKPPHNYSNASIAVLPRANDREVWSPVLRLADVADVVRFADADCCLHGGRSGLAIEQESHERAHLRITK
jgi:hypothetical protein